MGTRLERFTQKARVEPQLRFTALMGVLFDPEGLLASFERQDGERRPELLGYGKRPQSHAYVEDRSWEPDGVTVQVRFCEEPGTNRCKAEILWHRRETRR